MPCACNAGVSMFKPNYNPFPNVSHRDKKYSSVENSYKKDSHKKDKKKKEKKEKKEKKDKKH